MEDWSVEIVLSTLKRKAVRTCPVRPSECFVPPDSGSSFEPHLHFEVTTGSSVLDGEGVPYVIDEYGVTSSNRDVPEQRTHELPLNGTLVQFGRAR
jgi:hypothetical protein